MPRFSPFDHRFDNQIVRKEDLRFHEQETAEEFAVSQYLVDFVPRSVIRGVSGLHLVLESPETRTPDYVPHPSEVFYVNSTPGEG